VGVDFDDTIGDEYFRDSDVDRGAGAEVGTLYDGVGAFLEGVAP